MRLYTEKYAINLVLTEEDLLPNIESIDGRFGDVLLVTSARITRINTLGQIIFSIEYEHIYKHKNQG